MATGTSQTLFPTFFLFSCLVASSFLSLSITAAAVGRPRPTTSAPNTELDGNSPTNVDNVTNVNGPTEGVDNIADAMMTLNSTEVISNYIDTRCKKPGKLCSEGVLFKCELHAGSGLRARRTPELCQQPCRVGIMALRHREQFCKDRITKRECSKYSGRSYRGSCACVRCRNSEVKFFWM